MEKKIFIISENKEQCVPILKENTEMRVAVKPEKITVKTVINDNYEDLKNLPQINGTTLIGNVTNEELSIVNDKNYVHNQTTASDTWVIIHNLEKYPAVNVINSANEEVIGEVVYNNINQITLIFNGAFKGKATLN